MLHPPCERECNSVPVPHAPQQRWAAPWPLRLVLPARWRSTMWMALLARAWRRRARAMQHLPAAVRAPCFRC
jgi:hypothetical protein